MLPLRTGHAAWPSKVMEKCQAHEYDRTTAPLHARSTEHIHRHLLRFLFLLQNNKFNNTKHQH